MTNIRLLSWRKSVFAYCRSIALGNDFPEIMGKWLEFTSHCANLWAWAIMSRKPSWHFTFRWLSHSSNIWTFATVVTNCICVLSSYKMKLCSYNWTSNHKKLHGLINGEITSLSEKKYLAFLQLRKGISRFKFVIHYFNNAFAEVNTSGFDRDDHIQLSINKNNGSVSRPSILSPISYSMVIYNLTFLTIPPGKCRAFLLSCFCDAQAEAIRLNDTSRMMSP